MRPTMVVNPADDPEFAEFAEEQLDLGWSNMGAFRERLRQRYPAAAIHARLLSGEHIAIWYVYRDGSWTRSRRPGDR